MQKYIINIPEDYNIASRDLPELSIRAQLGNMKPFYINTGLKMEIYDGSPAEQRGAEKAWEIAGKIAKPSGCAGMTYDEIFVCFGTKTIREVFDMPYFKAAAMYEAWKAEIEAEEKEKDLDLAKKITMVLVEEGQNHSSKYGLKLGEPIKFTPFEVAKILDESGLLKKVKEEP